MAAAAACISCASSHPRSPPPPSSSSSSFLSLPTRAPNWARTILIHTLASSLSLSLSFSSPALATSTLSCQEQQQQQQLLAEDASSSPAATGPVTNKELVEEAWQVVEDSFFDARLNHWSPDKWKEMRGFVLDRTIKTRSKAHDLIRRMLATLDDHYTRFLTPSEFAKMAKYDVTGIGINLRELPNEDGTVKVRVLGIVLDGPAHVAGVRQGDEVLAVNGEDVRGKSAFEVSSLLQGPKETYVTLEVKHGNCGPVESYKVQRQVMVRTPVYYKLEQVENGASSIGYIRLKEFNALARKDLLIAMKRLQASGATYFILDLRDNLGGLVQAGIEVAKLFLEEGETVTYTVGKDAQYLNNIVSDSMPLTRAPLAVLVNSRTASASEIVATALHDNCRAVLVGERTFGKGLIQSVFELRDGSGIVVTVGKYVTPNHLDINGNGVDPDFANLPAWTEITDHLMQCHKQRYG